MDRSKLSKRTLAQIDALPPEKRAAVEARVARFQTPEYRAEERRIREEVRKEYPPRTRPDPDLAALLASLRAERERLGLSLTDMSERTGMDRSMLSKFENGHTPNPSWAMLRAYARAMGLARLEVDLTVIAAAGPKG